MCDYSDAYILVSRTIAVPNTGTAAALKNRKKYSNKNCAPFSDGCIGERNIHKKKMPKTFT